MTGQRDFSTRPGRGRSPLSVLAVLLGAAAVMAASFATGRAWRRLEDARARVAETRVQADELRGRLARPADRRGADQASAALPLLVPPGRVVADVAGLLPPGVRLDGLSVAYRGGVQLELRVAARTPEAYDAFLDRVLASPRLRGVLPGDEGRSPEMRATVRATYVGEGQ